MTKSTEYRSVSIASITNFTRLKLVSNVNVELSDEPVFFGAFVDVPKQYKPESLSFPKPPQIKAVHAKYLGFRYTWFPNDFTFILLDVR